VRAYNGSRVRIAWRFALSIRFVLTLPLVVSDLTRAVRFHPVRHEARVTRWLNDLNGATHGRGQDLLGDIVALLRRFVTGFSKAGRVRNSVPWRVSKEVDRLLQNLRETGLTVIDELFSQEEAARVLEAGFRFGGRDDSGRRYDSVASWLADDHSPRLFGTFHDEHFFCKAVGGEGSVLRVVSEYLGCIPSVVSVNLWLTKAHSSSGPEDAGMNFHCDADYISFVKMFVILTDTPPNGGGTEFISGSHTGRRHVLGRISTEDAKAIGPVIQVSGLPGRVYLCDTRGWHRAGPPGEHPRGVLQILFAADLFGKRPSRPFPLMLNDLSQGDESSASDRRSFNPPI